MFGTGHLGTGTSHVMTGSEQLTVTMIGLSRTTSHMSLNSESTWLVANVAALEVLPEQDWQCFRTRAKRSSVNVFELGDMWNTSDKN